MPTYNKIELGRVAQEYGFVRDTFEKVLRLNEILKSREKITTLIKRYMEAEGYQLSSASRFMHSLDAFYYQYTNVGGNRDMICFESASLFTQLFRLRM